MCVRQKYRNLPAGVNFSYGTVFVSILLTIQVMTNRTLIRKRIVKALLALQIFLFPVIATAQKNTSFQEGEKLSFRVYYNASFIWINSGNADFEVESKEMNGRDVFHITGNGNTAKSFEWFYKVRDKYETFVDKETMLPVRFLRNVNEGGMKFTNDVIFNQSRQQAISEKKVYTIPKSTQDVLSAIYYARNINYNKYKEGDKIPFSMFLDNQVYNLYIKYQGKVRITTKMGTFNAIKIVPLLIEGTIFKGGEKMTVYVSDDDNHVPVRIESPILVGTVKVDLMDFSHLRNPFSSMISRKHDAKDAD